MQITAANRRGQAFTSLDFADSTTDLPATSKSTAKTTCNDNRLSGFHEVDLAENPSAMRSVPRNPRSPESRKVREVSSTQPFVAGQEVREITGLDRSVVESPGKQARRAAGALDLAAPAARC
jgi:hypothetical protein